MFGQYSTILVLLTLPSMTMAPLVGAQETKESKPEVKEKQRSEAFVRWARENAIPITTTEPGEGFYDLQPLKKLIGKARVVGLGESIHRAHEFHRVRHRLLEFLVAEMGFTAFAMETGFAEAVKINDYVLGHIEEPERWQHNWVTWGLGYEEEFLALVRWMRHYNQDPRHPRKLRFYGIDVAVSYSSPLAALKGALSYLETVDPEYAIFARRQGILPLVGKFPGSGGSDEARGISLSKYKKLPARERDAYTAAVADLVSRFKTRRIEYVEGSSEDAYEWALRYAVAARQLDAAYRAAAAQAEAAEEPRSGLHRAVDEVRDRAMADNVLWAVQREGAGGRVALWAHNSHLMKTMDPEQGPRLGLFLDSMLGRDYVNVGFAFYQGAPSGWASYQTGISEPAKDGTLDGELARVGLPLFVLDLRAAPAEGSVHEWLDRPWTMRSEMREWVLTLNPLHAWDALFYIEQISPARGAYEPE